MSEKRPEDETFEPTTQDDTESHLYKIRAMPQETTGDDTEDAEGHRMTTRSAPHEATEDDAEGHARRAWLAPPADGSEDDGTEGRGTRS